MAGPDLSERVSPGGCAVLTMEIQRGVVGDLSCLPPLRKAAESAGLVAHTSGLVVAARGAGVPVIHCTAAFRRDRRGSFANVPMVTGLLENPDHLVVGSAEAAVVPELGPEPEDLVVERLHGMSPFTDTSLDAALRSFGVTTVIATGVSLNIGVIGLVIEAVNRGYWVVVPEDCVVGFPLDYGRAVLANSLVHIAQLTSAADIIACWEGA